MPEIEPFTIHVPDRELADLHARLARVRLPEPETVPDATQGIELNRLTALLEAWREHDWRAREIRWNTIPHYRARLDPRVREGDQAAYRSGVPRGFRERRLPCGRAFVAGLRFQRTAS
ncbi:epoxide hydrolase N-terminal domain-containing protein [Amycolatopsis sp. NPDC102389]|uniref:epoxide hydrolase N-terminal domain-containing protein n=1 Tax=Amycolatopsis sp. NPDC102389 TaxID=3363941 RepID=UPI003828F427